MGVQETFTTVILVQLFFSVAITGLVYYIPNDARNYLTPYEDFASQTDFETIQQETQENLERQTQIPVVELGALVFYSGNILIDLILNFAFAIPEMVTLLIGVVMSLVNVPVQIGNLIQLFVGVVISVLYFISIIQFIVGIRSGQLT